MCMTDVSISLKYFMFTRSYNLKGKFLYDSAWESRASIGREIYVKIEEHNGNITAKNSHEGRAVFAIKLPAG